MYSKQLEIEIIKIKEEKLKFGELLASADKFRSKRAFFQNHFFIYNFNFFSSRPIFMIKTKLFQLRHLTNDMGHDTRFIFLLGTFL